MQSGRLRHRNISLMREQKRKIRSRLVALFRTTLLLSTRLPPSSSLATVHTSFCFNEERGKGHDALAFIIFNHFTQWQVFFLVPLRTCDHLSILTFITIINNQSSWMSTSITKKPYVQYFLLPLLFGFLEKSITFYILCQQLLCLKHSLCINLFVYYYISVL